MQPFAFDMHIPRVVFGPGSLRQIREETTALGFKRALILSTPGQIGLANRVRELLGDMAVGTFSDAVMHVPVDMTDQAISVARRVAADCAVAIGGGSTTGLGKALALKSGLPMLAIPTTYAGSEMTTMWGLTEGGAKRTGRDPKVMPKTVIYDPELSLGLPFATTVVSAINAIAHAAEGLYAPDRNPIVDTFAEEGIRRSAAALPRLQANPRDLDARSEALLGACLCGVVMGAITVGLHHKLCHTLGGFGLPHAELHTVMLPQALAYNAAAAPEAMARIASALATTSAPIGLFDLAKRLGAATSLSAIGLTNEADLDRAADMAVQTPYPNPRPLERAAIRELLQRAYEGIRPD